MVFLGYYSSWRTKGVFVTVALALTAAAAAPDAFHRQINQDSAENTTTLGEHWAITKTRNTDFLDASGSTCDEVWMSWPSTQLQAMTNGTYFVYKLFNSVGNLFLALNRMLPVLRFLEMGIVLDSQKSFPGFRQAFEPGVIMWEIDLAPLKQRALEIEQGGNINGFHALTLVDGLIVLSDAQLELIISTMGISASSLSELVSIALRPERHPRLRSLFSKIHSSIGGQRRARPEPCTWNMFLRRSPFLLESLELHSPWLSRNGGLVPERRPAKYVGWHIRTPGGESNASYVPAVHRYIIQESPEVVCPAFESATQVARTSCQEFATHDMAVYISSNSKSLARSCIEALAEHETQGGQVDLGLGPQDAHTRFSLNPNASMNAFLDYVFLLDATAIIRSGSSFSGTIVTMRGFVCQPTRVTELPERQLLACAPKNSSC